MVPESIKLTMSSVPSDSNDTFALPGSRINILFFRLSFLCVAFTHQSYILALKLLALKDATSLCHSSHLDCDKTSDPLPGSFDEQMNISNENSAENKELVKRGAKNQGLKGK